MRRIDTKKLLSFVALPGVLLLPPYPVQAAGLDPAKALTQLRHDVWRVEQGLPQNTVPAITQTPDGYIWFGTELGLVRFDGLRFTVFDKANTPELLTNTIFALLADRQGNLWIGTNGGGLTRLRNGVFHTYTTKDGLASDAVLSVYEDRAGSLWVGTNGGGLSRLESGRFTSYTTKDGLADNAVFAIAESSDGSLWIGTHNGLSRLANGSFSGYGAKDGLRSTYIKALYAERGGDLWIGTNGGGLSRLAEGHFKTFTKKDGLPGDSVSSLREDEAGSLWIGTIGGGVCRLAAGKFTAFGTKDGLSNDDVWSLYYDRGGNLWIGTGGGGLNRFMEPRLTAYDTKEGLSNDMALPVFEDRAGDVWIGTNGGGVNRLHDGRFTALSAKDGLADDLVLTIAQDPSGAMWFGTRKGLNRYHNGRFTLYNKKNGLAGNSAVASLADSRGRLWIGTRGGVSLFENGKITNYTGAEGLSAESVLALEEDGDGSIWIGTAGGGLNRLRDGKIEVFDKRRGLTNNVVMALRRDSHGALWIGTNGGGLNRYKDGRFVAYTTKEGLPDDVIFQILEDSAGNLWMTSNKGIFRCALAELDRAERQAGRVHAVLYDRADGMKGRECNGGFQPAGWKARDGRLWFPTMKGVVSIDPRNLGPSEPAPAVVIEEARINRQPADPTRFLEAPPGSGELEFRYAAISFRYPEKTTFRYKLEGFDRDWIDAGTRREAYYTNIPPGRYRFLVTAIGSDGARDATASPMTLSLRPHWWVSWWFRGLAVSLSLALILSVVWWKDRMSVIHKRRLEALVQERTAELRQQVQKEERARTELAQAHQRLIELSRQAGMAEVATGILHNVGNVLNSVNVSATLLGDAVKELRAENLRSVVEMLQQHADDLTAFVASDPKGQRTLPYLAKLGGHFQEQRRLVLCEVDLLRERICHIKEIVSTQQRYAKVSGLTEQLELSELVEDAIRIIQPGLDHHTIRLERDFQPVPLVYTDKHNVLQILLNLLRNAKQAITDGKVTERKIRISVRRHGMDRVRIEVRDTGIGVTAENLTRIFAQGFTTKPGAHGFGLHFSALAAHEMGGSLWAESDGPGLGATFTLDLPVSCAETTHPAPSADGGRQPRPAAVPSRVPAPIAAG